MIDLKRLNIVQEINNCYYNIIENHFPPVIYGTQINTPPIKQYLMSRFERQFISMIAQKLPYNSVYLEIGSFTGWNLINVRKSNPLIKVISIDSYGHLGDDSSLNLYKSTLTNLKTNDVFFDIHLLRGKSNDLINTLPNKSIDCAFIDGDHSFEGCLKDIIEIWPKLTKNAILFGHDSKHEGVQQCIDYIMNNKYIKCPWGVEQFQFKLIYKDVVVDFNLNEISNGIWYSIVDKSE